MPNDWEYGLSGLAQGLSGSFTQGLNAGMSARQQQAQYEALKAMRDAKEQEKNDPNSPSNYARRLQTIAAFPAGTPNLRNLDPGVFDIMEGKNRSPYSAAPPIETPEELGIPEPEKNITDSPSDAGMPGGPAPLAAIPISGDNPLLVRGPNGVVQPPSERTGIIPPQKAAQPVSMPTPLPPTAVQVRKPSNPIPPQVVTQQASPAMSWKTQGELEKEKQLIAARGREQRITKQTPGAGVVNGGPGGIPRGLATLLKSSGFSSAESNRIDALASSLPIHNQIIDAIAAYENGNPSVSGALVNQYVAAHPDLSGFFQTYQANPNNQAALYDALTRLGAIEQYRLQNGSIAMPTEEAVKHNQSTLYPTLQEVAAKSPTVPQKLNALVETTITPAIGGPMMRIGYMRDRATGKFPSPFIQTVYDNLENDYRSLGDKIKKLPGYQSDGQGVIQVPPEQSGLKPQYSAEQIALAKQALADPNATPEHKAAAQKILAGQ